MNFGLWGKISENAKRRVRLLLKKLAGSEAEGVQSVVCVFVIRYSEQELGEIWITEMGEFRGILIKKR